METELTYAPGQERTAVDHDGAAQDPGLSSFPGDLAACRPVDIPESEWDRIVPDVEGGTFTDGDVGRIVGELWDAQGYYRLMFVPGIGGKSDSFLWYDRGAWEPASDYRVQGFISDRLREFHLAAETDLAWLRGRATERGISEREQERREAAVERQARTVAYYRSHRTPYHARQIVEGLKTRPELLRDFEDLNPRPDLLVVANGTVDLRTGELLPHSPEHLATTRIEVAYDEEAIVAGSAWDTFLRSCHPDDPEVVDYLQALVGYSITGESSEHAFVLNVGNGSNGKSVFTSTVEAVFSGVSKTVAWSVLEARQGGGAAPELAQLHDARLLFASEGNIGTKLDEAVLKSMSGGDVISARYGYSNTILEFRPRFTVWLASNHSPRFRDGSDGLWRRVRLIEWKQSFRGERADRDLPRRLREEPEVVLAWAVDGAVRWYRDGLQEPASIERAIADYRRDEDVLGEFLGVVLVEADGERVFLKDAHDAYLEWAPTGGPRPMGSRAFANALRERLGSDTIHRSNGVRWVEGYRIERGPATATPVGVARPANEDLGDVFPAA